MIAAVGNPPSREDQPKEGGCGMYQKTIDLARVSGGRMMGEITISARYWETRYSWGHSAEVTMGLDPYRAISKRDSKQMKSAAAEMRRLHRLDAIHYARGLYDNLCAVVDGKAEMPHHFTAAELVAA